MEPAISEMPEEFTIRGWIQENRSEVTEMCLFEYDEKEHMPLEREEGISDTKAIGTISEQYEMDSAEIRKVISANQQVHYESAFLFLFD